MADTTPGFGDIPPVEVVMDAIDLIRFVNTPNQDGILRVLGKYHHGTDELEGFVVSLGAIASHLAKELAETRQVSQEAVLDTVRRKLPGQA